MPKKGAKKEKKAIIDELKDSSLKVGENKTAEPGGSAVETNSAGIDKSGGLKDSPTQDHASIERPPLFVHKRISLGATISTGIDVKSFEFIRVDISREEDIEDTAEAYIAFLKRAKKDLMLATEALAHWTKELFDKAHAELAGDN